MEGDSSPDLQDSETRDDEHERSKEREKREEKEGEVVMQVPTPKQVRTYDTKEGNKEN